MLHLIDPDVNVLDVSREVFATAGFDSLTFDSPVAYLDYINSEAFVPAMAMLTCYIMPDMDGYQLITEVRKKHPLQRAILITGSPTHDAPADAEHRVCLHLNKPFKVEEALSALNSLSLCDETCARNNGIMFEKACKFGLNHACPFYAAE